ncbi:MAG TPA: M42 family metallopeptidase [Bacteroidia bacterium]|nr:M42 family metallopeptidase [Bacteroidia bacterium]HNT79234.1 M42 family metallopeptidase [Bacteroidia bacterium]
MNIKLLQEICETAGAPGFENRIRKIVTREIKDLVDDIQIDKMGNVIALKKGSKSKKVMIAAHMDEIGFIVTHVDDKGFVRFHTLGGFDPKTLTSQRVIIHGKKDVVGVMGSKPIHLMQPEERNKAPQLSDYYIDLGMSKKEVDKLVIPGDAVTRERSFIEMGDCFNCKSLDNRISVFILIEALRLLKKPCYDTYAVFTVQEEVGLRGAYVAAHQIDPDFGFGLDTTIAFDTPGAQAHEKVTELGKGVAIKIMDGGTICDHRMIAFMKDMAEKNKITHQMEVLPAGSTDTAGIQRMGKTGAIAGAVSIPTRHIHSVIEMVHKKDVSNAISLLNFCLLNLDKNKWTF